MAVDTRFVAAKRRILIRAVMTALVIALHVRRDTLLLLRTMLGAVSTGEHLGGHDCSRS